MTEIIIIKRILAVFLPLEVAYYHIALFTVDDAIHSKVLGGGRFCGKPETNRKGTLYQ